MAGGGRDGAGIALRAATRVGYTDAMRAEIEAGDTPAALTASVPLDAGPVLGSQGPA